MNGAFSIGRLLGVSVRIHFSWIFIFALITWTLASWWLPSEYPAWGSFKYWTVGVIGSLLLFVCILIHELSHSIEAIRRGIRVHAITLFFLGGVSHIDEESRSAGEEFWIAIVGPLTSLALSALFGLLFFNLRGGQGAPTAIVHYLMLVNLMVGVLNLVPAFPLDGGRVLRAIVWKMTGSYRTATRFASVAGTAAGFAVMGLGIYYVFTNDVVSGIWLILLGWFVQSSASTVRQDASSKRMVKSGRTVADAYSRDVHTIPPGASLQRLLQDHMAKDMQRAYLVMLGDTFHGLITTTDIGKVPPEQRESKWVSEVMTRAPDVITLTPDAPLEDGLRILAERGIDQLVVMECGKPVGLLTRAGVLRVMEVAQLLPENYSERDAS